MPELPPKMLARIKNQDDHAEILIGWIQSGIVLLFAIFYMVSPKTSPKDAHFALVPWLLRGYAVLTAARLIAAYQRRLSNWQLYASIVADIGLLLGLIWSFHWQYDQPASLFLKSPLMLYLFIFISLRALRFDPRFVSFAGTIAAIGWAALLFASIKNASITDNYIKYLASADVLLSAEFEKIVALLAVTMILCAVLARARRLLIRSVDEVMAAQDLSRFFSPEVARRISIAGQPLKAGRGEMRDAAILDLDIRDFTSLTHTLPPDRVMSVLAQYQARMVPIIQRHGGIIDKFIGDGILATFGAAGTHKTYAAACLETIDEILEEIDRWNADCDKTRLPHLNIGISMAAGRVVFGTVGVESRLEFTVIGDAVNLAAKIETHNKVAQVRALTTAATYELAVYQGYKPKSAHQKIIGVKVAGIAEPINLVVLAT